MDSHHKHYYRKLAEKTVKSLEKHFFSAVYVEDEPSAISEIMKFVKPEDTVGVGGSSTVRDLGVLKKIEDNGCNILDHWEPDLTPEEIHNIRIRQLTCDLFLTSSNAVTLDGKIVNTDGIGNRVCAMTFGPKQIIIVVGINKLVKDTEAGIRRIKEKAGPLRAASLNTETPCTQTGICTDCNQPQRICRTTVIFDYCPAQTNIHVIIIGKEFGF